MPSWSFAARMSSVSVLWRKRHNPRGIDEMSYKQALGPESDQLRALKAQRRMACLTPRTTNRNFRGTLLPDSANRNIGSKRARGFPFQKRRTGHRRDTGRTHAANVRELGHKEPSPRRGNFAHSLLGITPSRAS